MAQLQGDIKKLKRGELAGTLATIFCGIVLIYFAVCFSVASALDLQTLQTVTLITAPILMVAGIAVAAYCNLKFGGALDKAVKKYITQTFVENAALMHPERNSLTFYITVTDKTFELQVNAYRERIVLDFTEYGKISLTRKAAILSEIERTLCATFCRLYERGGEYTDVSYAFKEGTRRKAGKTVYIIKNAEPDKKAFKTYLKK